MTENKPKETKHIDPTKASFMANGKEYFITSALSAGRYCEYQILEKEVGFSMTFDKVFKEINEVCELMNEAKFVDCAVRLDNLRRGVAKLEQKEPSVLKLCTLFINTADEDPATWDNDLMTRKIEDWKTEGIDIKDFFELALNSVNGFIDIYKKMSKKITDFGTPKK